MSLVVAPSRASVAAVAGIVVALGYVGVVMWAMSETSYAVWAALVFLPIIVLGQLPLVVKAGHRDPDPRFAKLLIFAFFAKVVATVARYKMAFVWYGGVADAAGYHRAGARLAEQYRDGNFNADLGRHLVGTGFIRMLTGVIYTITGPSLLIGYAVYSCLGFWGLYFLYRAFRVAVPQGDAHRYALLVLLLPSMLFWPSGLGKDAWMTLGIGLVAYGSALLFSEDRRWLPPLLLGVLATVMVRPHITVTLFVGMAVAYLVWRRGRPATELTPVTRVAGAVLVVICALALVGQAASFLGVKHVSAHSVDKTISQTATRTSTGGSVFHTEPVTSPVQFPQAVVSVLFRPFPTEATNAQMLIAASEGSLLMLLFAGSIGRLRWLTSGLRRQPYLVMCLVYTSLFVYAFSEFANFGILTRERVQVMPFALVLLALPKPAHVETRRAELTRPTGALT